MKVFREIFVTLLIAVLIFAFLRVTVQNFQVQGMSMLPGIEHGEYIVVNKAVYLFHSPEPGEIIVFRSTQNPQLDYIKRVIALPGDIVEVKDGKVFVNNALVTEPYTMEPPQYTLSPKEIPPDHYFVLGDNRNYSQDSHSGWTVPRDHIIGKAWYTVWPPSRWRLIKHYSLNVTELSRMLPKLSSSGELLCPVR